MNTAYLHILTVHLPVIGTPVLIIWMLSNLKNHSEKQWKWLYATTIFIGILTGVSYFTGPATADWVKTHLTHYPQDLVENHALLGRLVFVLQTFASLIGIMALSSYWQGEKPSVKLPYILLIVLIITTLLLLYTAHLGGMIRRTDLM